jgi:peptidoglycan/LPS O-acetylase OafA/YrhL
LSHFGHAIPGSTRHPARRYGLGGSPLHLTTRFVDRYRPEGEPWLSFPLGHYGVNLFFMISGFVISMTLQRTTVGMGFVVSRFSRLCPQRAIG